MFFVLFQWDGRYLTSAVIVAKNEWQIGIPGWADSPGGGGRAHAGRLYHV